VGRKAQIETAYSVRLTPSSLNHMVDIVVAVIARYLKTPEEFAAFGRDLSAALPFVERAALQENDSPPMVLPR